MSNFSTLNIGDRRLLPGSDISRIKTGTFTLNPASLAAGTSAEQSVTIQGLTTADKVLVFPPPEFEELTVGVARVTETDTMKFMLANVSAGPIDAMEATWSYLAIRA